MLRVLPRINAGIAMMFLAVVFLATIPESGIVDGYTAATKNIDNSKELRTFAPADALFSIMVPDITSTKNICGKSALGRIAKLKSTQKFISPANKRLKSMFKKISNSYEFLPNILDSEKLQGFMICANHLNNVKIILALRTNSKYDANEMLRIIQADISTNKLIAPKFKIENNILLIGIGHNALEWAAEGKTASCWDDPVAKKAYFHNASINIWCDVASSYAIAHLFLLGKTKPIWKALGFNNVDAFALSWGKASQNKRHTILTRERAVIKLSGKPEGLLRHVLPTTPIDTTLLYKIPPTASSALIYPFSATDFWRDALRIYESIQSGETSGSEFLARFFLAQRGLDPDRDIALSINSPITIFSKKGFSSTIITLPLNDGETLANSLNKLSNSTPNNIKIKSRTAGDTHIISANIAHPLGSTQIASIAIAKTLCVLGYGNLDIMNELASFKVRNNSSVYNRIKKLHGKNLRNKNITSVSISNYSNAVTYDYSKIRMGLSMVGVEGVASYFKLLTNTQVALPKIPFIVNSMPSANEIAKELHDTARLTSWHTTDNNEGISTSETIGCISTAELASVCLAALAATLGETYNIGIEEPKDFTPLLNALRTISNAQVKYAKTDRDGNGKNDYAQNYKFLYDGKDILGDKLLLIPKSLAHQSASGLMGYKLESVPSDEWSVWASSDKEDSLEFLIGVEGVVYWRLKTGEKKWSSENWIPWIDKD